MSEGFFATAEVLVVPNTADFAAALKAQLAAAVAKTGPLVVPIATEVAAGSGAAAAAAASATASVQALNVAQHDAAASAIGLAAPEKVLSSEFAKQAIILDDLVVATNLQNDANLKSVVANDAAAASTKNHARAAGQAERAIGAQAASIAGLRGAALTASAPFLVATVAIIAFGKSIKEASDHTEELNKSAVVFGQSSQQIKNFADTTASSLGISSVQALRAAGIFGNLFRTIKISEPVSAAMSQRLVELAADLASFNNADPSRTLEALRSGLVGQARPLRVFGIFISQARAQQEALIETGKKNTKELTNAELVQARYNIILKDSALAQGDFARTSGRLANQSRILKAELADLATEIGTAVIPGLLNLAQTAGDVFKIFKDFKKIGQDFKKVTDDSAKSLDRTAGSTGFFADQLSQAETAFGRILVPGRQLRFVFDHAAEGADRLAGTTNAAVAAAERAAESLPAASTRIADLTKAFQEGGGRGSGTALNQFILGLQKLQAEETSGLVTNDQLANRIRNLIKQLQDPNAFNINIKTLINTKGLAQSARQGGQAVVGALADVLSPQAGAALGLNFILGVGTGIDKGTKTVKAKAATAGAVIDEQIALAQASGNQGAELSGLRAKAANQQAFLDRILALPQTKKNVALATKAANNLAATNAKIKSITDGIISDQKSAAADRKQAVQDAAQAQQDATQAFIDLFAPKQQRLQNRLTTAQTFGNVTQQIAVNQAILAADQAEIKAIKTFIKNKHLKGAALKAALAEIKTIQQDEFNTRNAIRQLTMPDPQAIIDARAAHLDAQIAIAEASGNAKVERAAEKARIAFDKAQIARITAIKHKRKLTLDEAAQLDAYRVDLAQRNKALHDLQGTADAGNKAAAKFFFDQLQAQQGFASNLLGNLITGSTAGLVGVPSPAAAAKAAGAIPEDRIASERTRQQAKTTPGPTAGQHQTTNDILIRILHALTRQNRTDQAPEAHHQRRVGAAIMDNDGIHGI